MVSARCEVRSAKWDHPSSFDAARWIRIRAICCRSWGLAPWEFDRAVEEGLVAREDVMAAVGLECLEGGVALWLHPEVKERAEREEAEYQEKVTKARFLRKKLLAATTDEERAEIQGHLRGLNDEG